MRKGKTTPSSEAARLLGSLGGKARAKALTPEQRREIAKKAIKARWTKRKPRP